MASDRLHDFARAVATRQAQQDPVDEDTMRAIALDLGMSEAEIVAARAEGSARKERAQGLRQRGLLDDAIAELEQAAAWNPLDVEVMTLLADCFVRRGRKLQKAEDLERGRQLCLQALQVAPANTEAPAILQVIQMNPVTKDGGGTSPMVMVVGGVIAVIVAVIAAIAAIFG
jgi:tetratricopeptide (TPR) repeat protein